MQKLLNSIFLITAILAPVVLSDKAQAEEGRIYCDTTGVEPMTVREIDGQKQAIIVWREQYWSSRGYTPESRCNIVSTVLNDLYNSGEHFEVGISKKNGENVLCALDKTRQFAGRYGCGTQILTMHPKDNMVTAFQNFVDVTTRASGTPWVRSATDIVDFSTMLEYSIPVE